MIVELGNVSIFKDLGDEVLGKISLFSTETELDDGEILISEHQQGPSDLFVLCKGSVEIVSNDSAVTSNEVSLSKLDKDIFGEIGWLCNGHRSATVRSVGEIQVIRIDGKKLAKFIFENPEIGLKIVYKISQTLAERLSTTDSLLKQVLWNTGY